MDRYRGRLNDTARRKELAKKKPRLGFETNEKVTGLNLLKTTETEIGRLEAVWQESGFGAVQEEVQLVTALQEGGAIRPNWKMAVGREQQGVGAMGVQVERVESSERQGFGSRWVEWEVWPRAEPPDLWPKMK
jgi:hypothetical protein